MIKISKCKTRFPVTQSDHGVAIWVSDLEKVYVVSEAERQRIRLDYGSSGVEIKLFTGSSAILVEGHPRVCHCSHCRSFIGKWGLRRPASKAWNSWTTFFWTWNGRRWYIRWTPSSLWKWRRVDP